MNKYSSERNRAHQRNIQGEIEMRELNAFECTLISGKGMASNKGQIGGAGSIVLGALGGAATGAGIGMRVGMMFGAIGGPAGMGMGAAAGVGVGALIGAVSHMAL